MRRSETDKSGNPPMATPVTYSRLRYPLMALAMVALLAAIWAGWVRLGWRFPALQPALPLAHGPLMVSGFLGTLISLERAVALRRRWMYLAPVLSGFGGLLTILGIGSGAGALSIALGSLGLVAIFAVIVRSHLALYTASMAGGAVAWLVGNLLWLSGWPVYQAVLWWAAFLILTIAGERLELGRLARLSQASQAAFLGATGPLLAGLLLSIPAYRLGTQVAGIGMLALAAWLLSRDIARRTVRKPGLPRYAALCLLSGYVWLAIAGIIGLAVGGAPAGPYYDALLHAVFLGFVFSMIFGHAPIIFPAVLGIPVRFHPVLYLHLFLLHASLLARVGADLLFLMPVRLWAGMLNGVALLLFFASMAYLVLTARREERRTPAAHSPGQGGGRQPEKAVSTGEPGDPEEKPAPAFRWGWHAALGGFILAGATGALWRFGALAGLPAGLKFEDVRHAHSHLMFFGWVTPALMALVAAWLARDPSIKERLAGRRFGAVIAFTLFSALLSYPLFLLFGYRPAQVGELRLPLAVIASSLNILAWYAFGVLYWRTTRGRARTIALCLWDAALIFLGLASLGAWGRAGLAALGVSQPFWNGAMVHLFLGQFSEGWGVLALLGLAYASQGDRAWSDPGARLARPGLWMVFLGLPVTFLLGMPVFLVPVPLRAIAGLGGVLAGAGLLVNALQSWRWGSAVWRSAWGLPLAFLTLKAIAQIGYSLPDVAVWGERIGLRLPYLHLLLLGFTSFSLLVAAGETWGERLVAGRRPMAAAILVTLASLLLFTGLWPAWLAGRWTSVAAAWTSLLPVLAATVILLSSIVHRRSSFAIRPSSLVARLSSFF